MTFLGFANATKPMNELLMAALFATIMGGFLIVDLGWLNRRAHRVTIRSATIQSLFWIGIATCYGALMWKFLSPAMSADFFSAYLTEKMLSTDNLFVIMLLFAFFKIEDEYHHEVLYWGIIGAVLLRGICIAVGAAIVGKFHWVLYLLGAFLIVSSIKLLRGGADEANDFEDSRVLKFCRKHLPLTLEPHGGRFFLGRRVTMLFVTLVMIETTDVIFAFDSIPAVLAITPDPFVAFTSNMFAVMGLRALYFLVEGIMAKFKHLDKGVAVVLLFIGVKMLLDIVKVHISSLTSFSVIIGCLLVSLLASVALGKKERETAATAAR